MGVAIICFNRHNTFLTFLCFTSPIALKMENTIDDENWCPNVEYLDDYNYEDNEYYSSIADADDPPSKPTTSDENEKQFPEEAVENLIEAVREKPALWSMHHSDFKNRVTRMRLWEEVLSQLNLKTKQASVVRTRWDRLKSSYMRSKKVLPSGSGNYAKQYKYSRLLSFLDDTNKPRKTKSYFEKVQPGVLPSSGLAGASQSSESCQTTSNELRQKAIHLLEDMKSKQHEQLPPPKKTFAALTCDMILDQMEELPRHLQRKMHMRLFTVVNEIMDEFHAGDSRF